MLAVYQFAKNVAQLAACSINVPYSLGRHSGFALVEEINKAPLGGNRPLYTGICVVEILYDRSLLRWRRNREKLSAEHLKPKVC